MTTLLETAIEKVSVLPEMEQNIYAKNLLLEIESQKRWEKDFAESEEMLAQIAESALQAFENGKTKPLSQEEL